MAETVASIDLLELLETGRAGPIQLGKSDREAIRALIDAEDIRADNHYNRSDTDSPWCIYGVNCEFFFSPDFRLRHIKLIPWVPMGGLGGVMMTWLGGLHLDVGRHPVDFAGTPPIEIHTLPGALNFFHKSGKKGPIGGGQERDVSITLLNGSRRLEFRYEIQTLPTQGDKSVVFEIDYFLSAVWIVDEGVEG